jgi:predicted lipoprotein with Yx(FWY)xxD motif
MKDMTSGTTGLSPSSSPHRKWRFGVGMWALAAGTATIGLSLATLAGTASGANRPAATTTSHVVVTMKSITKYGAVLFDQKGLALYVDMSDKPPHFACTGACLTFWPALVLPKGQTTATAGKGVTALGTVKSPEGMQVTWRHMPLYTYAADSTGTVHGQGIKQWGTWYAANSKTAQAMVPTSAKTTPTTAKTTGTTSSGSSWG